MGLLAMLALGLAAGAPLPAGSAGIPIEQEVRKCVAQCPENPFRCELYCRCVVAYVDDHYSLDEYRRLEAAAGGVDQAMSPMLRTRLRALRARAEDCALDAFAGG